MAHLAEGYFVSELKAGGVEAPKLDLSKFKGSKFGTRLGGEVSKGKGRVEMIGVVDEKEFELADIVNKKAISGEDLEDNELRVVVLHEDVGGNLLKRG